ncbi:transposon Tn7 transposition protein TnsB [Glaciecola sp. 4H-3-7+YE-5]|nr:transposon Tn7 transposition protein TnsB [Glaciecola sp. 4H-3-7+YE-5]
MSSLALMHQAVPVFVKNDVIKWHEKNFRVIKVNYAQTFLFELDINSGFPVPFDTNELESSFQNGEVALLENHKYHTLPTSINSREKSHSEMTERYEIIKSIVESEGVLNSSERGRLIRIEMMRRNISKTKIYRILRAYWTFGQCIEAVSTNYHNCGAKGKQRQFTDQKPGRKRYDGRKENAIRTDLHTQFMQRAIVTFHFGKKYSLAKTYLRFVTYCKSDDSYTCDDNIPSIESLRHFLKSYYSVEHTASRRYGNRVYLKDIRTLNGTATASAYGPGARYELDATVVDVHIVCSHDRTRVLGRPILYIVIDLFSRLIVGFYIGFYSPSFRTATISLLSALQDKTHLVEKYNISKSVCSSWPGVALPDALISDKAELFGLNGSHLAEMTSTRIENTASGRSDAKGVVERHFGVIQRAFEGDFDGKPSKPGAKKSGAIDGRLTATLTFDELQEIIVSEIIVRNNCHVMTSYDCEQDMPDDMPLTPINVWNWGIENRTGCLQGFDEERMKVAVLPRGQATVSREGIRFKGLFYTSNELEKLGWFIRIKNNTARPKSVQILYDPMQVNQVYVIVPNSNQPPLACNLKTKSRAFHGNSFLQVEKRIATRKETNVVNQAIAQEEKRKLEEKTIAISQRAKKEKKRLDKKTIAQTKREISKNRDSAREDERKNIVMEYSPVEQQVTHLDNEYRGYTATQDEFANPELNELFNLNNDKEVDDGTNGINDD